MIRENPREIIEILPSAKINRREIPIRENKSP